MLLHTLQDINKTLALFQLIRLRNRGINVVLYVVDMKKEKKNFFFL